MGKFVRITGAETPETQWFSRFCNALGGQIGHSLQAAKTAAICMRQRPQPCKYTLFALFLAYYYGLKRVFDPVYEFMT